MKFNKHKIKRTLFCHLPKHKQSHSFSLSNSTFQNQYFAYKNNLTLNNIEHLPKLNNFNLPQFSNNLKSPLSYRIFPNQYTNPRTKINVGTRNKPNLNTFDRPIVKRTRKPNKTKAMNSPTPNISNSVATQTDGNPPSSNIGQGREPIDEAKRATLFEFENETPPDYRRNLSRVFGE